MNNKRLLVITCLLLNLLYTSVANAQDKQLQITGSPFDSLAISNLKATGLKKTGEVTITLDIQNKYSKDAKIHLSLGGYEDFGVEDDKRNKYKIHTSEQLIGTKNINKGYKHISSVQFGDKKMGSFTYVIQELAPGDTRKFTARISQFDKTAKEIVDMHLRFILFLNYAHTGDLIYKFDNIPPIDWK